MDRPQPSRMPSLAATACAALPWCLVLPAVVLGACGDPRAPGQRDPAPGTVAIDTSRGEVLLAVPTDSTPASPLPASRSGYADTTPIVPTARELEELRRTLIVPVQGVVVADLRDTYTDARGARVHHALDILAPRGTPVLSASDGKLLRLHSSRAGGLMIYAADATDRFILMYAHLDRYADGLAPGMPLRRGQVIGYVGTTGNAPPQTPHLHFAIARGRPSRSWWKGTPLNPFVVLGGRIGAPLDDARRPAQIARSTRKVNPSP